MFKGSSDTTLDMQRVRETVDLFLNHHIWVLPKKRPKSSILSYSNTSQPRRAHSSPQPRPSFRLPGGEDATDEAVLALTGS